MTQSPSHEKNGFFPEAAVNFLALLGWNDGTEGNYFHFEELAASV
jgi:glutamyl-tRNA synthetase